jgi:hypothetical protein
MIQIPLQAVPAQTLVINLNNQNVQIAVYQKPEGLFVDINLNGTDIVTAVLALNGVPLVCREYMGFQGNIMFVDTQGTSDPTYAGLNTRYELIYYV